MVIGARAQWNAMTKAASYAQKVRFHNISSCWEDWRYCSQQNNILHTIATSTQFTFKFLWRYATLTCKIIIVKPLKTAQIRRYRFSLNQIRIISLLWKSEMLKRICYNKSYIRIYCTPCRNIVHAPIQQHPRKWPLPRTVCCSECCQWILYRRCCRSLLSPALTCDAGESARCNILLYVLMRCYILDIRVFTANCLYMNLDCVHILTQVWKVSKFHFFIIWKWNLLGEMLPIPLLLLIIWLALCNISEI